LGALCFSVSAHNIKFGMALVIGEAWHYPGHTHDDYGAPPAALKYLYEISKADIVCIDMPCWELALPEDPGDKEPVYDWTIHDALIDPLIMEDKLLVAFLGLYAPSWLREDELKLSGRFWRLAEHYLRALIPRVNQKGIYYFVFENEPNMGVYYPDEESYKRWDEYYMARLHFAYKVLKSIDKNNVVIGGNLAQNAAKDWERLYALGFKECSDLVGYHPYSNDPSTGINIEDIVRVHKVMERAGDGDKPFYFGEGWGPGRALLQAGRTLPEEEPSEAEIMYMREFVIDGYRSLTTPHEGYNPEWTFAALFFTMNDNFNGIHDAERAVPRYDEEGNLIGYLVDGHPVNNPSPTFWNGGLVDIYGHEKDMLVTAFPDGNIPGYATVTIACDGQYTLYIDGKRVHIWQDDRWDTNEIEFVKLSPGQHIVALEVRPPFKLRQGLIFDLRYNGRQVLVSDASWWVSSSYVEGWEKPDFDDSKWLKATVIGGFHCEPWRYGYKGFVDSKAKWIWLEGKEDGSTLYFRRKFTVK